MDANTTIELCAGQKKPFPKVRKFGAKMFENGRFSFQDFEETEKDEWVIGGKDSCQVSFFGNFLIQFLSVFNGGC